MKVAFHSNQLDIRGTGVALYQYAHHNEAILGNESMIVVPSIKKNPRFQSAEAAARFERRFPVYRYDDFSAVDPFLKGQGVDVFYAMKSGRKDGIVSKVCRTCVHVVFQDYHPHGDVYACISEWLAGVVGDGRAPFVPYMVELPDIGGDMRTELGIQQDAVVFGRHGGEPSFDIEFAREAVRETAERHAQIYFLFMNTNPFCDPLPNIIHLPATAELEQKVRFINSCDAMLHARKQGESFGSAIAEFSARNKPVVTFKGGVDQAHLHQLGETGIYYESKQDLMHILGNFEPDPGKDWDVYSERFAPGPVMEKFRDVFLADLPWLHVSQPSWRVGAR